MKSPMRRGMMAVAAVLALPALTAAAGFSKQFLVPTFEPCQGPATCSPRPQSSYTFSSMLLKRPVVPYLKQGATSLILLVRGVKDASGALVTTDPTNRSDDFKLKVAIGRVTIPGLGTLPDDAIPWPPVGFDLKDGNGTVTYKTPGPIPIGLVTEGGTLTVLDNRGERFATTASMASARGLTREFLVPAFGQCPGPGSCLSEPESAFTFRSIFVERLRAELSAPGKPSFRVVLKGVKSATGVPVTTNPRDHSDDFSVSVDLGRVTILDRGTLPDDQTMRWPVETFDLRHGNAIVTYITPGPLPPGIVSEGGTITVLDNQGHRLAAEGGRAHP